MREYNKTATEREGLHTAAELIRPSRAAMSESDMTIC